MKKDALALRFVIFCHRKGKLDTLQIRVCVSLCHFFPFAMASDDRGLHLVTADAILRPSMKEDSEWVPLPFWFTVSSPPPTIISSFWLAFHTAHGALTDELHVADHATACVVAIAILRIQRWWRVRLEKKGWPSTGLRGAVEPAKSLGEEGFPENFFRRALRCFGARCLEDKGCDEEPVRTHPVEYHITFRPLSECIVKE